MADQQTVLVVEHEAGAPAGWFGEHLEAAGLRLDVRRPYAGDDLSVEAYDGLLVLGGAMDSWVGKGPNQPIAPSQLAQALGPELLQELEGKTGIPQQTLLDRLVHELPEAMDHVTPQGRLPSDQELAAMDQSFSDYEPVLAQIRARGLHHVHGLLMPGVDALSAPVFNAMGQIAAVMTVVGPTSIFHADEQGPAAKRLLAAAGAVSKRMGYEPAA